MDEFVASARINQYERGKHVPTYSTLEQLSRALGCPAPYFYTRDDDLAEIILLAGHLNGPARRRLRRMLQR